MCDHCLLPSPPSETRRSFLRKVGGAALAASLMGATRAAAQGDPPQVAKSGWARIVTPEVDWNYHGDREARMAAFVAREAGFKFDTKVYHVYPSSLEKLCAYPFLFTNDLMAVRRTEDLANIREYLYRGGFIYIDDCVHVTPDFKSFEHDHLALLTQLVPEAEVRRLSSKHPIFRAHFPIDERQLLPGLGDDPPGQVRALYGVFDDDHMVALLSMEHFFCGWPENPPYVENWMKQIANIYAYSRAH